MLKYSPALSKIFFLGLSGLVGSLSSLLLKWLNPSRVRSAFAEGARVSGGYGGKPVSWSLAEFCDAVARGGPAPGLQARIVAIETAGAAAMARLEALDWRGTRYTDFFVMVRRDGGWRIDSKVFHAHARA